MRFAVRVVLQRRLPHLLFAIAYAIVALIVVFARPAPSPQALSAHTAAAEALGPVPVAGR